MKNIRKAVFNYFASTRAFVALLMFVMLTSYANAQDALCYTEQVSTKEKGLLGTVNNDVKLFYEAWNVKSAGGTSYSAIILRTDTTRLNDSIDFCLDVEHESDTVFVSIARGDSSHNFATTRPSDIPTLFQVLKVTFGRQQFYDFNKPGSQNKIYLRDNSLVLTYQTMENNELRILTDVYTLMNGQFRSLQNQK